MKPEHTKNIKKFIKKYKSILKLPFMNKFSDEPNAEAIGKPMVEILPSIDRISEEDNTGIAKLAAKYDPTAKVSGGFGKSPIVTILNSGNKKEAALTGEVKSDGPETIVRTLSGKSDSVIPYSYLKPTDTPRVMSGGNKLISPPEKSNSVIPYSYLKPTDTPRVMSGGNKLISLPKTDVKKLVDLSLTNQITNKIIKTKNNEYTLKIPEYGIGKNIISGLMSVVKAAKPAVKNAAKNFGTIGDKLNPLTDALKSAKKMGMSLISQTQRDESSSTSPVSSNPATPPVVTNEYPAQAVKGNPVSAAAAAAPAAAPAAAAPAVSAASTTTSAAAAAPTPTAAAPTAAAPTPAAAAPTPVAASGSISTATEPAKGPETKIESNFDNGVGSDPQQAQAAAEETLKTADIPEEAGAGAARGIAGIVDAVTTVAQVAGTIATGGVGGAAFGALKGVGAMAGGASKVAGGLGKVSKLAGAMPGGGGEGGGGGGGGMGVPGGGMGSMLGGGGNAALAGGALAAVGGIAAGVGGVAAGIGSAVGGLAGAYATVGGKLIDAVFGGNDKKESVSVSNDARSNATIVNSVSNQYDVYRKTADDSFMLPNYRREYG